MASTYQLTDHFVQDVLATVDGTAREQGLDYALVGGLATQSHILEGVKNLQPDVDPHVVDQYLRETEDVDLAFLSEEHGDISIFFNEVTDPTKTGFDGDWKQKNNKYTGTISRGQEGMYLNANENETTGIPSDIYEDIVHNAETVSVGNGQVNRERLEDVVWTKLQGYQHGRQKDRYDLASLLYVKGEQVDENYLQNRMDETQEQIYNRVSDEDWQVQTLEEKVAQGY